MWSKIKESLNYFCFYVNLIITYIGNFFSCKEWRKRKKFNRLRTFTSIWADGLTSEKLI